MNGLFLHTGNRLESLAADLARVVAQPLASPFTPEIVMVQSLGMHRWVSLQLAQRLGICMRCEFPFPRAFLDKALRDLVPKMARPEAFSVELMTWKINRLLPMFLDRDQADDYPEFAPVRRYWADGDAIKLYQLAGRLAHLFDQYLVYRPAMLLEWERNPHKTGAGAGVASDEAWQATLWRELNRERHLHFGAVLEQLVKQGNAGQENPGQRISIFGISSLPPAQMQVFFHLAASRPVHLFLLAPSSQYHGDDLTPKQRARRGIGPDSHPGLGLGFGNPLLTSLGRLNAHFTEILLEADERSGHRIVDESEHFVEPPGDTLLHRVQRDILLARDPSAALDEAEGPLAASAPAPISIKDRSIQVHVCHSPMREVEVLYDQLLAMLDEDGTLLPREILVMAPDIEKYAPFIHAVFGYPENPALRIPFSVADRHPRSESLVIDTFLRLLELPGTRCTGPQLFSLFQSGPLRKKFDFSDSDLDQIRLWIGESGIRWGLDSGHREALGFPGFHENTWRHGLDRLLLGYAMAGQNRVLFEGILPHDDVEGSGAELLGRLASALEAVSTTVAELGDARPLAQWPAVLEGIVERFFGGDDRPEEADAARRLRGLCGELAEVAFQVESGEGTANETAAHPPAPAPLELIREYLTGKLGEAEQHGRFLTGGVTFCALKPMRSIPARVIWLLGMDDGAFPRKPQPLQFDLMARHWKLGDRSVRDDDRYIFLEALLSARDRLCISTVGRSQASNEAIPPSVVVSELLDYLDQTAVFSQGGAFRDTLVFEHRLQAFSRHYFEPGSRLFSYSAANAAASHCKAGGNTGDTTLEIPFAAAPLPEPEAEERHVSLDRLLDFFSNPAAFFLRHRLGLRLEERDDTLAENEPVEIGPLEAYTMRRELFEPRLRRDASSRRNPNPAQSPLQTGAFTARALIPPGRIGALHLQKFDRQAAAFYARVAPLLGTPGDDKPLPFPFHLELGEQGQPGGGFTLSGSLDSIYGGRLVLFRPARLKPKDWLRAWLRHLVRCALPPPMPAPLPTLLAGEDETVEFRVLPEPGPESATSATSANPAELLEALLRIYWDGLSKPAPFFPASAYAYIQAQLAPPSSRRTSTPLGLARLAWEGGFAKTAERDHPAYRLCFGDGEGDPLGDEFERLAQAVYGPMLGHAQAFQAPSTEENPA